MKRWQETLKTAWWQFCHPLTQAERKFWRGKGEEDALQKLAQQRQADALPKMPLQAVSEPPLPMKVVTPPFTVPQPDIQYTGIHKAMVKDLEVPWMIQDIQSGKFPIMRPTAVGMMATTLGARQRAYQLEHPGEDVPTLVHVPAMQAPVKPAPKAVSPLRLRAARLQKIDEVS